jgi:tetratricopeptide (TPR) repeat protein
MAEKENKPASDQPKTSVLKWVGGTTAILSLILGLYQVTKLFSEARERHRSVVELHTVGKDQQNAGNYQGAWTSFEQALERADQGGQLAKMIGQLDADRQLLREAQEDLAMAWVEDIRVPEGRTFSEIVDKLIPVLTRGAANAAAVRKSDLLAHLGWAYFLKRRDSPGTLDPEQYYRQSLETDANNPYGHVHWGHWLIWEGRNLEEGTKHFSAAVASGRALPYVRRIQLAALENARSETADGEFLRAVNDMRKNQEPVDATTRADLHSRYYFALNSAEAFQRFIAAVPPVEQIATMRALFYEADFDPSKVPVREAALATLQEAAGLPDEALQTWLTLHSGLSADSYGTVMARADAAIKRLSKSRPQSGGR